MLILERLEGDWAVLELDGKIFQVPAVLLPPDAREGVCLGMEIFVDAQASKEREDAMRKRFDRLF